MTVTIHIPHYSQSRPGYCLPACARMVLEYWGISKNENEISRLLGTRRFGTPGSAILKLTPLGVEVSYTKGSVQNIITWLDARIPVILSIRTGFIPHWTENVPHAIVLVGAELDSQFWVHDPAIPSGPTIIDWNALLASWSEMDYFCSIIRLE